MRRWIAVIAVACSVQQLMDAVCRNDCQWRGYDGGSYEVGKRLCSCSDLVPPRTEKRMTLPGRKINSLVVPYVHDRD